MILSAVAYAEENGFKIDNSTKTYKKAANYPGTINLRDKGRFYLDMEGNVADLSAPILWNAEKPYLYTVVVKGGFALMQDNVLTVMTNEIEIFVFE